MTWDEIRAKCQSQDATPEDFALLQEIGAQTPNPDIGMPDWHPGKLGHAVTHAPGMTYYWIGQPERWLRGNHG